MYPMRTDCVLKLLVESDEHALAYTNMAGRDAYIVGSLVFRQNNVATDMVRSCPSQSQCSEVTFCKLHFSQDILGLPGIDVIPKEEVRL